jgi:hypothetical protein
VSVEREGVRGLPSEEPKKKTLAEIQAEVYADPKFFKKGAPARGGGPKKGAQEEIDRRMIAQGSKDPARERILQRFIIGEAQEFKEGDATGKFFAVGSGGVMDIDGNITVRGDLGIQGVIAISDDRVIIGTTGQVVSAEFVRGDGSVLLENGTILFEQFRIVGNSLIDSTALKAKNPGFFDKKGKGLAQVVRSNTTDASASGQIPSPEPIKETVGDGGVVDQPTIEETQEALVAMRESAQGGTIEERLNALMGLPSQGFDGYNWNRNTGQFEPISTDPLFLQDLQARELPGDSQLRESSAKINRERDIFLNQLITDIAAEAAAKRDTGEPISAFEQAQLDLQIRGLDLTEADNMANLELNIKQHGLDVVKYEAVRAANAPVEVSPEFLTNTQQAAEGFKSILEGAPAKFGKLEDATVEGMFNLQMEMNNIQFEFPPGVSWDQSANGGKGDLLITRGSDSPELAQFKSMVAPILRNRGIMSSKIDKRIERLEDISENEVFRAQKQNELDRSIADKNITSIEEVAIQADQAEIAYKESLTKARFAEIIFNSSPFTLGLMARSGALTSVLQSAGLPSNMFGSLLPSGPSDIRNLTRQSFNEMDSMDRQFAMSIWGFETGGDFQDLEHHFGSQEPGGVSGRTQFRTL